MTVYCVNDEYGEHLIIAASIRSLINYLIELDTLNKDTDIVVINENTNDCEWTTLEGFYGDCWQNTIANLTVDELNDLFFEAGFIFSKKTVID